MNRRLELVRELGRELAQGWDFVDEGREERLLSELAGEDPAPLSDDGLRELFRACSR